MYSDENIAANIVSIGSLPIHDADGGDEKSYDIRILKEQLDTI